MVELVDHEQELLSQFPQGGAERLGDVAELKPTLL